MKMNNSIPNRRFGALPIVNLPRLEGDPFEEFAEEMESEEQPKQKEKPESKVPDVFKSKKEKEDDSPFDISDDGKRVFDPTKGEEEEEEEKLEEEEKEQLDPKKQRDTAVLRKQRDEARKEVEALKQQLSENSISDEDKEFLLDRTPKELIEENKALQAKLDAQANEFTETKEQLRELNIEFDPTYKEQYQKPLRQASDKLDLMISEVDGSGKVKHKEEFAKLRQTLFKFNDGKPVSDGRQVKAVLNAFKKQYEATYEEPYDAPEPVELLNHIEKTIDLFQQGIEAKTDWENKSKEAKLAAAEKEAAEQDRRAAANKKERVNQFREMLDDEIAYDDYQIVGNRAAVRKGLSESAKSLDAILEGREEGPNFKEAIMMNWKANQYDLLVEKLKDEGLAEDSDFDLHGKEGDSTRQAASKRKKDSEVEWADW